METVDVLRMDSPTDRHHAALVDFYEHFPTAEEATFVTAKTFADLFEHG